MAQSTFGYYTAILRQTRIYCSYIIAFNATFSDANSDLSGENVWETPVGVSISDLQTSWVEGLGYAATLRDEQSGGALHEIYNVYIEYVNSTGVMPQSQSKSLANVRAHPTFGVKLRY
jgi:hypothetical protein